TSSVSDTAPSATATVSQIKESQNKFGLKVVVADELGGNIAGAMNVGNINTKTYAGNDLTYGPIGQATMYWANTLGVGAGLILNKAASVTAGYINAEVTNTGFNNFTTSQSNQTVINMGVNSPASSITSGGNNNVKGFEFGLKIYNRDEIDSMTNNFTSADCSTYIFDTRSSTNSNGYYYYWANTATTLGDLDIQRVGFVDYQVTHLGLTGANGITITPSAGQVYINMNGANDIRSTSITTGGTYNIEGLKYSLKVIVYDELIETDNMSSCTVTYKTDAGADLIGISNSVSNSYYIAPNAISVSAGDLTVSRTGYVKADELVDSTMNYISTDDSTEQLVVTLTGHTPNNSNTTATTSGNISIRGMYFTIKVLGTTDEWNNRLYMRDSNTLFSISTKVIQKIKEDPVSSTSNYYRGYVAASPTTGFFKIQTYGYVERAISLTVVDTAQITVTYDDNSNAGHSLLATNNISYNNTPAPSPAPAGGHYDTYGLKFALRILGATNELANKINLTSSNTTFTSNDTELGGFTIITDQANLQLVKASVTSEEGLVTPAEGYGFVAAKQQDFNNLWNGALTIKVTDYDRRSVATTARWSDVTYLDYDSGDYTSQFLAGMGSYVPGNDGDALVGMTGGLPPAAPNLTVHATPLKASDDVDGAVTNTQITISGTADKWSAVQIFVNGLSQDSVYWYNGSYTDETSDAANITINDVTLGSPTTEHALYVGNVAKFDRIHFKISTPGTVGDVTWEYYNGSSWTSLSVTDGTESTGKSFAKSGVIAFTKPANWAATSVNSITKYWIRARTSANYTITPLGDEVIATFTADGITGNFSKNITLTEGTNTIYANARDDISSGPGPNSSSISVFYDQTAPSSLSLTINDTAGYTASTQVSLSLSATDASGSGLDKICFSNDGTSYSSWEDYNTAKTWTVTTADGVKTVHFKVKDIAGNEATAVTDTTCLDTTAPSGTISIANGNEYTTSATVTLNLSGYADGGSGLDKVCYSNDGSSYSSWENAAATKTNWSLTSGDGVKTVYYRLRD
ncbi:hypothetical protein KKD87_06325, partial [bacterium]|nr:hypothetical protein [bacterium]